MVVCGYHISCDRQLTERIQDQMPVFVHREAGIDGKG